MKTKVILINLVTMISINIFGAGASAATVEERLAELENKTSALEKGLTDRLSACKLVYKSEGARLNTCSRGSFVKSIVDVGGNSLQLECGFYQLECN